MSIMVKLVPDADYEILRQYLDAPGVVLIRKSIARELFGKCTEDVDELEIDYDFGGEADVWADFIRDDSHYAVEPVRDALNTTPDSF